MPPIAFFHAPGDAVARSVRSRPTLPDDGDLCGTLGELEHFLTDRPYVDILCDDRHLGIVTEFRMGMDEYVVTLTDTLRDALAGADDETLRAAASHWPATGELTAVARSAASAGERLYAYWSASP